MRADRRAREGARKAEYLAGLTQSEELWTASRSVGPEASPILLFYALAQASRAVCVAGLPGDQWKAPASHGVECKVLPPAEAGTLDLGDVRVEPTGDSLLFRVARVVDSPVLQSSCSLAELIASLDNPMLFSEGVLKSPKPLRIYDAWRGSVQRWDDPPQPSLKVGPVPVHFAETREIVPASETNLEYNRIVSPAVGEVGQWLAEYPTLAGLGDPHEVHIGPSLRTMGSEISEYDAVIHWEDWNAAAGDNQFSWTERFIDRVDSFSGPGNQSMSGVVYPAVGGNSRAMHPLITWWLILYGTSVLARYHPRAWVRLLNLDESVLSVPMRHLLEVGYVETRNLVAEVLLAQYA